MTKSRWTRGIAVGAVALAMLNSTGCEEGQVAQAAQDQPATFQVDPWWPPQLPDNWILGQASGIAVDGRDHVWVLHRPTTIDPVQAGAGQDPPVSMCCVPAPPLLELDPEGAVVAAWGDAPEGYEWPAEAHGVYADHEGNIWVGGGHASPQVSGHYVLKFSRDGELLLQIGERDERGDSNDTRLLGGPTAMDVDPERNEVYIADGYQNRRVIVFDAETGEYRRHWGAYGNVPEDDTDQPRDYAEGPDAQFRGPVHGIAVSNDGLVYVADRSSSRVQIFTREGEFVDEFFVRPETLSMGSVWEVILSSDPEERWIYIPDGTNHVVWIVDRETLEVVDHFGHGGRMAGEFDWVHNVAVDSEGNLYTSEVNDGKRVQKFVPGDR